MHHNYDLLTTNSGSEGQKWRYATYPLGLFVAMPHNCSLLTTNHRNDGFIFFALHLGKVLQKNKRVVTTPTNSGSKGLGGRGREMMSLLWLPPPNKGVVTTLWLQPPIERGHEFMNLLW